MNRNVWIVFAAVLFIAAAVMTFFGVIFIIASGVQAAQSRLTIGAMA